MSNQDLLLLLERPKEPVFVAKGDQKAVFDVPNNLLSDRFKPLQGELTNRFRPQSQATIRVNDITPPNLNIPLQLSRYENFSLWIPKHRNCAGRLIEIFMACRDVEELKSNAVYARDVCNPYLFNYAFTVALLHRKDTNNLNVPSFMTMFPDKFVDGTVLQRAREESEIVPDGSRMPIVVPRDYTATDLEPEHRIAYWREDLGINLHHWHWHLVYPFSGPMEIVNKDRRGELFFYMHQQIQARYNFERFCNKLARVQRITDWRAPVPEGYFPKLDSLVSSRGWPSRMSNSLMTNVHRPVDQLSVDIDDFYRWRDRIYAAIHSGQINLPNGTTRQLGEFDGIDILGNIIEASILTPNSNFYGDLHNMGHVFLGYIHDPDGRHLESFGVVADPPTAMRDPCFYRLHEFVDDIFQEFKSTLPPYSPAQLDYRGVTVQNVEIAVQGGGPTNTFQTFWQQSDVDLSRGMDFTPRGPVFARFTHLQHQPFQYQVQVNNAGQQRMGTCRIFLAPKFDERGLPWLYRDQKVMFIELDRFTVSLRQGMNTIVRRSDESSITIPWNQTFRDVDTNRPAGGDALAAFNYCGCGWPQHVLLPRGSEEGFPCELFVMISNYEDDRIDQAPNQGACKEASSFCGLKDKRYPDARSMGYPFDRPGRPGVDNIQSFLYPNMRVIDCSIRFTDRTVVRGANA